MLLLETIGEVGVRVSIVKEIKTARVSILLLFTFSYGLCLVICNYAYNLVHVLLLTPLCAGIESYIYPLLQIHHENI